VTGIVRFRIQHLSNRWDSFSSTLPGKEQKCPERQGFPQGRQIVLGWRDMAGRVLFLSETVSVGLVIGKKKNK